VLLPPLPCQFPRACRREHRLPEPLEDQRDTFEPPLRPVHLFIVTLPAQKRHNGYSCHGFALCGAAFYLFVGGRIPEMLKPHCLARTRRVYARPSDRLMRELGEMIVKSPPKGAVARRLSRQA